LIKPEHPQTWLWWPLFLLPFAALGGLLALWIWHELPAATRRYINEVENKPGGDLCASAGPIASTAEPRFSKAESTPPNQS
jgi:hypothetical protein